LRQIILLIDCLNRRVTHLIRIHPALGGACRLKTLFNDLRAMPDKPDTLLKQWCAGAEEAKIPAFMKFANTVRAHWSGIVHYVESHISFRLKEGINHKVRLAKHRAWGCRNIGNFIVMTHLPNGSPIFRSKGFPPPALCGIQAMVAFAQGPGQPHDYGLPQTQPLPVPVHRQVPVQQSRHAHLLRLRQWQRNVVHPFGSRYVDLRFHGKWTHLATI
jgi:hypothetical protein